MTKIEHKVVDGKKVRYVEVDGEWKEDQYPWLRTILTSLLKDKTMLMFLTTIFGFGGYATVKETSATSLSEVEKQRLMNTVEVIEKLDGGLINTVNAYEKNEGILDRVDDHLEWDTPEKQQERVRDTIDRELKPVLDELLRGQSRMERDIRALRTSKE